MNMNQLNNLRIEFHILQSFPVTCLNRDDVGAPKTAIVGGVQRARVSSQAWKRAIRGVMHDLGGTYGVRTKLIGKLVKDACRRMGATEEDAAVCGEAIEGAFIKKKKAAVKDQVSAYLEKALEVKKGQAEEFWEAIAVHFPDDDILSMDKKDTEKRIYDDFTRYYNENVVLTDENKKMAEKVAKGLGKMFSKLHDDETKSEESDGDKSDTLLFLSEGEINAIAQAFCDAYFKVSDQVMSHLTDKKGAGYIAGILSGKMTIDGLNKAKPRMDKNDAGKYGFDAVDIALFGRMVAQAADMNIDAAASFSHAISTHKVNNDIEFFTAMDDLDNSPGAAHMGNLEFNSATYYRYISLDVGQLSRNLHGVGIETAVENFTKALFLAVPAARQATQSGASPWGFAKILVRSGQRMQVPFEKPVAAKNGSGFLEPSIEVLDGYLRKQEKLYGSLFGKVDEYTFAEDGDVTIDDVIAGLKMRVSSACTVAPDDSEKLD